VYHKLHVGNDMLEKGRKIKFLLATVSQISVNTVAVVGRTQRSKKPVVIFPSTGEQFR
jgi:hypothetical protein